jgi:hypothetical protein
MCPSQAPKRLDGFYSHSLCKSLAIIGWFMANMDILAPDVDWPRKKTDDDSLENSSDDIG